MTIEFNPPALERIIHDPNASRRLRNREGEARLADGSLLDEGKILQVYLQAVAYQQLHPEAHILVREDVCGAIVSPIRR